LRVLLVEDEALIACMTEDMLLAMGHAVDVATSVSKAREALIRQRYDLVITDLGLPDGSGSEIVTFLLAEHPDVFVIVASGGGFEFDAADGGGNVIKLAKPYGEKELKTAVASLSGLRKAR
jgi:DNA-binding response OmpR family regulator